MVWEIDDLRVDCRRQGRTSFQIISSVYSLLIRILLIHILHTPYTMPHTLCLIHHTPYNFIDQISSVKFHPSNFIHYILQKIQQSQYYKTNTPSWRKENIYISQTDITQSIKNGNPLIFMKIISTDRYPFYGFAYGTTIPFIPSLIPSSHHPIIDPSVIPSHHPITYPTPFYKFNPINGKK